MTLLAHYTKPGYRREGERPYPEGTMQIVDHNRQPTEEWRAGVLTRMRVSALTGAVQLCVFEQWCEPGRGAPTHLHAVEEVLTVVEGQAQFWVEDERSSVSAGQTVVVPAGRKHGFRNTGDQTLHVQATLAAPIFEASFDDQREISRRWLPRADIG
jgi:mannose-6-phosphate isomerase-like protein (cupin superfamily)